MKTNEGQVDRVVRVFAGLALIGLAVADVTQSSTSIHTMLQAMKAASPAAAVAMANHAAQARAVIPALPHLPAPSG